MENNLEKICNVQAFFKSYFPSSTVSNTVTILHLQSFFEYSFLSEYFEIFSNNSERFHRKHIRACYTQMILLQISCCYFNCTFKCTTFRSKFLSNIPRAANIAYRSDLGKMPAGAARISSEFQLFERERQVQSSTVKPRL